ncbi:MAG: hypothetical protein RBT76_03940 [candidate division Zixibacteria bacterium]|jgi:hypothetical protein|nr:hypothetical protein [candidate division Zixibacteria bacterium]
MKLLTKSRWYVACALILAVAGIAYGGDFNVVRQARVYEQVIAGESPSFNEVGRADYTGTIRVYIVEPISRWWDSEGKRYSFGFLDWGLVEAIVVPDNGVYKRTVEWNATTAGWSGVEEDSIQATVALFNSAGYTADAYPGYGYWFTAHNADAAAAAEPGAVGRNSTDGGFTHTVFIEQGSATW